MSDKYKETLDATKIQNGTFTELWWDDEYCAELKGVNAKDEFSKEEIKVARNLRIKYKVSAIGGKGSVTFYKVNSLAIRKLQDFCRGNAVEPKFTIMTVRDDPSGLGMERVIYNGVSFDDLTWINAEVGTLSETEMPFTYESVEASDLI